MYNVLSTGSKGNGVIYHNQLLVDCGIPYQAVKPFVNSLSIILLSHEHKDHISISTIKKIQLDRPSIRVGCCEWMVEHLKGVRNIDVFEIGKLYDYGSFSVSPVALYHDVKNCGYRIFKDNTKTFHATDTCHLEGITAVNYDLYAIEFNYNSETVNDVIMSLEAQGKYAHQRGSINSHLSEQQAMDFIFKNGGENANILRLHESKSAY